MKESQQLNNLFLNQIEQYHSNNLYLPTRTVYFGSGGSIENDSDEVNYRTVAQLIKNLYILEEIEHKLISIILNTPGGSWEDGIAVYDLITKLKSKTKIIGMGKLYSMGSVIFQSADKRILMPNTTIMIHDGSDGYIGDAKSFENWAKDSKRVREVMYKIYYKKMKQKNKKITLKDVENICGHDAIFPAKEAIKIGLADKII